MMTIGSWVFEWLGFRDWCWRFDRWGERGDGDPRGVQRKWYLGFFSVRMGTW